MKKKLLNIFLIFLCLIIPFSASANSYKVLRILDGDTFVVDFNSNGLADKNERIRVNGIDTFETKINASLKKQAAANGITTEQALKLGYLGKKFAEKALLNKNVEIEYSGRSRKDYYGRELVSIFYDCNKKGGCKSYEEEILKSGYAFLYKSSNIKKKLKPYLNTDKIKQNAIATDKFDIVVFHPKKNIYHEINCEYAWSAQQPEYEGWVSNA